MDFFREQRSRILSIDHVKKTIERSPKRTMGKMAERSLIRYNSFCVDSNIAYPNSKNPDPIKPIRMKLCFLKNLKMNIGAILAKTPKEPPMAQDTSFICSGNGSQINAKRVKTQGQKTSPPLTQQTIPCPNSCAIPAGQNNPNIMIVESTPLIQALSKPPRFHNSRKVFRFLNKRFKFYSSLNSNELRLDTNKNWRCEPQI